MQNIRNVLNNLHLDIERFPQKNFFLPDQHESGPIKLVLLVIGWLVGWLVGDAVFSETALKNFLIFRLKLGDYKGRKVTEADF